jgi:hypothetical protein
MLGHLGGKLGKLGPHRRGNVEHFDPFSLQTDLGQQFPDRVYSALSVEITFQVMAVAGQSPSCHNPVNAPLKGVQHLDDVEPAGAGHLDDPQGGRVLHPQRTRQISRSIGAMATAKGHNLGCEFG